jgi:hypothetical protein
MSKNFYKFPTKFPQIFYKIYTNVLKFLQLCYIISKNFLQIFETFYNTIKKFLQNSYKLKPTILWS